MKITERLRNTPTGFVIQVGTNRVQVKRFEAIYQGKAVVCRGCLFRAMELGIASTARLAWPI
ncbi:hypothetical protein NXY26_06995 [Parabacteroides distasonis]|nr:hypothetical protein NXY26_06995 [Parabacteroides distasonis]